MAKMSSASSRGRNVSLPLTGRKLKKSILDGPIDDDKLMKMIEMNATYNANVVDKSQKSKFPTIKSL